MSKVIWIMVMIILAVFHTKDFSEEEEAARVSENVRVADIQEKAESASEDRKSVV